MRIGINALYLLPGRVGGSEIYIRNLVRWLPRVSPGDRFVIFVNRESAGVFEAISPDVEVVNCAFNAASRPARILWEQFVLPFQIRRHAIDVLLSAGMTAPFFCPARSALVIHDLQHENQPENFSRFQLFFLKTIIRLSSIRADSIVAISGKVKKDIIKYYKIPESRIGIAYNGVEASCFFPRSGEEVERVRRKYKLPGRFILYIASALPHKNYSRLLEAFRLVKAKDAGIKLVLIGARDYGQDAVAERIDALGIKDDVVFSGWLPFEDIPLIYAASELFVFPSLHEGFGIPVIEAMATGVPVVCSDIEPLTEVVAGSALLVDPLSPGDMAQGMLKVLADPVLRERLVRDGLKRAENFSWEKTARDTLSLIYPRLRED